MSFDRRYQVVKFVAVVKGSGSLAGRFGVFTTGDDRCYLFCQLHNGCFTGLSFPVAKKDLRDDIRRALANGVGNAAMRPGDDGKPFTFLPPGWTWEKCEEGSPS